MRIRNINRPKTLIEKRLLKIAKIYSSDIAKRDSFDTSGFDDEDFITLPIWRIKEMLFDVYDLHSPLNEDNKNRRIQNALFGDPSGKIKTFAIISAENPLAWNNADSFEIRQRYALWANDKRSYNNDAHKRMKTTELQYKVERSGDDTLHYGGFTYVRLNGKYGSEERSFLILNLPLVDAKTIAWHYGQESFFWGKVSQDVNKPSKIGYYMIDKRKMDGSYYLADENDKIVDQTQATDYFSKYKNRIKFCFGMSIFEKYAPDIVDSDSYEKSFEEERTFRSRSVMRHLATGKLKSNDD